MGTDPETDPEIRLETEYPRITTELSRNLNLLHITMMGVGMMIGAGVFLGVGNAVGIAGPGGVILTFALNAVIALFTAMSYAELSSAVPRAGGGLQFRQDRLRTGHQFPGRLDGMVRLFCCGQPLCGHLCLIHGQLTGATGASSVFRQPDLPGVKRGGHPGTQSFTKYHGRK